MKKIPHAQGVNQALRAMQKAVNKSLKDLNSAAGHLMAKGDYEGANEFAAKGRDLIVFATEVETLRKRWHDLRSSRTAGGKKALTPLWEFYQPVLKALDSLGGEGTVADLIGKVETIMGPSFKAGDRNKHSRGKERWQVMITRVRKHLANEGWIEKGSGLTWRITEKGRAAAAASSATQLRN